MTAADKLFFPPCTSYDRVETHARWKSDAWKNRITEGSRLTFRSVASHDETRTSRSNRPFHTSRSRCQDRRRCWSSIVSHTPATKFTCLPTLSAQPIDASDKSERRFVFLSVTRRNPRGRRLNCRAAFPSSVFFFFLPDKRLVLFLRVPNPPFRHWNYQSGQND